MTRQTKEVKIDDLADDEKFFEMNLNWIYIDVQLICLIIPNDKGQKANIYEAQGRGGGNNQDVYFSQLFLCQIHLNNFLTENLRLLYLMEATNLNNMLFDRNFELHNNGTITIGTYFRVVFPLPIEKNNMKGDIPLVNMQTPIDVMHPPLTIPQIPVNNQVQGNTSRMAFVFNRVYFI